MRVMVIAGEDAAPVRWRWWPVFAALLVLAGYNLPLVTLSAIPLGHDGILQYYPAEHALAAALRAGTLPVWTPHLQAGFPLLAQGQPGPLYPINLLAFGVLPTPLAHAATLVLHQLLGFALMIWWGRMLGMTSVAAAGMGLLFALTPPLNQADVLLIETVTWIPLLFGLAERCVQRRKPGAAVAMIPVAALQWLAGFPQIALYTALATHVYLGVRVCSAEWTWPRRIGALAAWSGASVLGGLLAAPQLVPTYELSHYSIRAGGIPEGLAGEQSLFPAAILTFVLPSLRPFFDFAGLGMGLYLGILPAALALASAVARSRRPWVPAVLVVSVATFVLALGRYSPLFIVLRRLPGFAFFRMPSRYLYITQFGLITLAGLGWDLCVVAGDGRSGAAVRRGVQAALAVLLLTAVVGHPLLASMRSHALQWAERYTVHHVMTNPFHAQTLSYYQAKIAWLYRELLDAVSMNHPHVILPFGVVVAGAMSWWMWGSSATRGTRLAAVWSCLIVIDLLASTDWYRETTPTAVVDEDPPVVQRLRQEIGGSLCRVYWLADAGLLSLGPQTFAVLQANYNLLFDLSSVGVYAPLAFDAYHQLMSRVGTVDLGVGFPQVSAADVEHDRQLLDFLNVCYVLSPEALAGFTPVAELDHVRVYRNERAFPRAFTVGQVEIAAAPTASVDWVRSRLDRLRDTAVVEEPLPVALSRDAAARAQVSLVDYRDTAVAVDITAADAVLLVVTDTDYPGWFAFIDGQPTQLYRTDAIFRGVVVPGGTHHVVFRYRPIVLSQGLGITAAAALAALAWVVTARWHGGRG